MPSFQFGVSDQNMPLIMWLLAAHQVQQYVHVFMYVVNDLYHFCKSKTMINFSMQFLVETAIQRYLHELLLLMVHNFLHCI